MEPPVLTAYRRKRGIETITGPSTPLQRGTRDSGASTGYRDQTPNAERLQVVQEHKKTNPLAEIRNFRQNFRFAQIREEDHLLGDWSSWLVIPALRPESTGGSAH